MANDDKTRRRGGGLTFLMAFAAVIMSGTSLYQQNQSTALVQSFETRMAALKSTIGEKIADARSNSDGLGRIRERVSEAMEALLTEDDIELVKESLIAMNERIEAQLEQLRGDEDADEATVERLEALKSDGEEALKVAESDVAAATEKVRGMFREIKRMDREGDES